MAAFDAYKDLFPHARLTRSEDGVLEVVLHTNGATLVFNGATHEEFVELFHQIGQDARNRVVILTGAGGHFCAGGDVKSMRQKHSASEGRARVELLNRFVLRLFNFPKPVIAMVDGFAVGAGCNIALGCDMIVASDRARFGEVFLKIGLVPDGGGTWLLQRLVGLAKAKELVLTAEIIDAAEAGSGSRGKEHGGGEGSFARVTVAYQRDIPYVFSGIGFQVGSPSGRRGRKRPMRRG